MKTFFPGPLGDHSRNILRKLGYGEQRTRQGQISYVRRVAADRFPRYHAYVEDVNGGMQVNLHVDQKEASYEGTSAHAGEYEGPVVEREMQRIHAEIRSMIGSKTSAPSSSTSTPPAKKSGFVSKFFN